MMAMMLTRWKIHIMDRRHQWLKRVTCSSFRNNWETPNLRNSKSMRFKVADIDFLHAGEIQNPGKSQTGKVNILDIQIQILGNSKSGNLKVREINLWKLIFLKCSSLPPHPKNQMLTDIFLKYPTLSPPSSPHESNVDLMASPTVKM